jgi:hypothetical protein
LVICTWWGWAIISFICFDTIKAIDKNSSLYQNAARVKIQI